MTPNSNDLTQQFKHFLHGMQRGQGLNKLHDADRRLEWAALARRELERRATAFLQDIDDEMLEAIAAGHVDVTQAIHDVATET